MDRPVAYCMNCGTPFEAGAANCASCGTSVTQVSR
jgi:rRNA maturation endonuclease Nob1